MNQMRSHFVIWFAILQHIVWGAMLLFSAEPLKVTAIFTTAALIPNRYFLAIMLLGVGLLALWTMRREHTEAYDLWAAMPQQFVLMMSAVGSVSAISRGAFGDGAQYSRWFIASDQLPAIILAILHTACLLRVFAPHSWTETKLRWINCWTKHS